jgi:hypothetical protein
MVQPLRRAVLPWFARKVNCEDYGWFQAFSTDPEICNDEKMTKACANTAFAVAKLLTAKLSKPAPSVALPRSIAATWDGQISFDLGWTDEAPEEHPNISSAQLNTVFSRVDKVFLVKAILANDAVARGHIGDYSHSFVVSSYRGPQGVCCGLYMSYATAPNDEEVGYTLPDFLNGDFEFAPKADKDIPMADFTRTFATLFDSEVTKAGAWRTLFGLIQGRVLRS